MEIRKELLPSGQLKPLFEDLMKVEFGTNFTDYMFTMEYTREEGWKDPAITPYHPLVLDPATIMFHYSQAAFEGQKAYRSPKDEILLFRPAENARRMNRSMARMCIPEIPEDLFLQAECELLKLEKRWIPTQKGTSLYIRPTVIPTEVLLGAVRPSDNYLFYIILSPVGPFYKEGFNPIGLWVDKTYSRAASGGTGAAKTGGNYAGSIAATLMAKNKGYSQVLWLDAKEHRYVEEVGTMNVFFVIEGKLVTPPLTGTILPGITRKSLLEMAGDLGIETEERLISIDELAEGVDSGRVTEVFGAGTAAVISPVGRFHFDGKEYVVNNNETGYWAKKFFDTLTGIQYGESEDKYGWVYKVE
ncbi:MAG: branched-chain amino acid aminotransferase [Proteobacteria bacterium]|nr:branched-chain amino acid aminotransferase [Pseudomonadota bacterium]NIS68266.1 branched-chain amino acid aminotransferase [Pseudomonadota bacterium]